MTVETLLQAIRAEQARQADTLAAILRALERTTGPRDAADLAVLLAVGETVGDRRWTCRQLIEHAAITPALEEAIRAADITDARDLGFFCKRVHGSPGPGIRLERADESRAGILWRVVVIATQ